MALARPVANVDTAHGKAFLGSATLLRFRLLLCGYIAVFVTRSHHNMLLPSESNITHCDINPQSTLFGGGGSDGGADLFMYISLSSSCI